MEIEDKVKSYSELDGDWDGYGGTAPPKDAVSDSISFLQLMGELKNKLNPEVSSKEVGLYYNENDIYIEITFSGNGLFSYYGEMNNREKIIYGDDNRLYEVPEEIYEFLTTIDYKGNK